MNIDHLVELISYVNAVFFYYYSGLKNVSMLLLRSGGREDIAGKERRGNEGRHDASRGLHTSYYAKTNNKTTK